MNTKQPRALYLLFFVEMWERFSYYGMRVLLVLYMIERLDLSDFNAFGVFALYTALVEIGAVVGGYVADRILGLRPSIVFGGALIALGHLCLTVESGTLLFFMGLGLIVTGTTLFASNIKALLGLFYEENDPRREAGFTLFYTGINVGGFLASLLCGWVGQTFGWHVGFGMAAGGMVAALAVLTFSKRHLKGKGEAPPGVPILKKVILVVGTLCVPLGLTLFFRNPQWLTPFLPLIGMGTLAYIGLKVRKMSLEVQRGVRVLVGMVFLLMVYFVFEELTGSLLMVFCERHVDRAVWAHVIPSSVLVGINPLTIILFGTLLSRLRARKGGKTFHSASFAFLLLGGGFLALVIGGLIPSVADQVPVGFVALSFLLIAVGELFIAPTVYSFCSQVSPKEMQGVLMALVIMGFSYASLLSGSLGQLVVYFQDRVDSTGGVALYTIFFALAASVCFAVSGGVRLILWVRARIRLRRQIFFEI